MCVPDSLCGEVIVRMVNPANFVPCGGLVTAQPPAAMHLTIRVPRPGDQATEDRDLAHVRAKS